MSPWQAPSLSYIPNPRSSSLQGDQLQSSPFSVGHSQSPPTDLTQACQQILPSCALRKAGPCCSSNPNVSTLESTSSPHSYAVIRPGRLAEDPQGHPMPWPCRGAVGWGKGVLWCSILLLATTASCPYSGDPLAFNSSKSLEKGLL